MGSATQTAVVSTEKAKALSRVTKKKKKYGKVEVCMLASAVLTSEITLTSKV